MMLFRAPVMRFGGQYGVLESDVAAEGEEPSPLANDPANLVSLGLMSSAGRVGASYLWVWLTEPTVGTIQINDRGALRIQGLPDGTHVFSYRGLVMPSEGSPVVYTRTVTVQVEGTTTDTEKPVMTGTISLSALTSTSYTTGVNAATDNVGVTAYAVSQDGGSTWVDKALVRTHNHTGRTPDATDEVRWRARDAAGNWSDPLSRAVTLLSAGSTAVVTAQPTNATVPEGATASFVALFDLAVTTGWQVAPAAGAFSDISGATSAMYTTGALTSAQNGNRYRRFGIGTDGQRVYTNEATLTVTFTAVAPTIIGQPSSQVVAAGQTATFVIAVVGTAPIAYQWFRNGVEIAGATASAYTTPPLLLGDHGAAYHCVASNAAGSVVSNAAVLIVTGTGTGPIPGTPAGMSIQAWYFHARRRASA